MQVTSVLVSRLIPVAPPLILSHVPVWIRNSLVTQSCEICTITHTFREWGGDLDMLFGLQSPELSQADGHSEKELVELCPRSQGMLPYSFPTPL